MFNRSNLNTTDHFHSLRNTDESDKVTQHEIVSNVSQIAANEVSATSHKVTPVPKTVWLTGLSGAGKSTLAEEVRCRLLLEGRPVCIIDGDVVRTGLSSDLGFDATARMENVRRVAEMCKLINASGVIAVAALISPTRKSRALAKQIVGESSFVEVYVSAALEVCEKRDPKGLYERARTGAITRFTGISDAYEPPEKALLELNTAEMSIDSCANEIMSTLCMR